MCGQNSLVRDRHHFSYQFFQDFSRSKPELI